MEPRPAIDPQEVPALIPVPPAKCPSALTSHREGWVRTLPWVGVGMGAVAIAFLVLLGLAWPGHAWHLAASVGILFSAGKEAAIPFGVADVEFDFWGLLSPPLSLPGIDPWLMGTWMVWVDVAATFLLYPLVHVTLDSLEERGGFLNRKAPFAGKMVRSAVRRAERKRKFVDRWGVVGLYLFSIIPFAFNGPPIVAALGRLTGLRASQVIPVLLIAITTTSYAWALFYDALFASLEGLPTWIPIALSLSIMAVMLTVGAVGALLDKEEGPAAPPQA